MMVIPYSLPKQPAVAATEPFYFSQHHFKSDPFQYLLFEFDFIACTLFVDSPGVTRQNAVAHDAGKWSNLHYTLYDYAILWEHFV